MENQNPGVNSNYQLPQNEPLPKEQSLPQQPIVTPPPPSPPKSKRRKVFLFSGIFFLFLALTLSAYLLFLKTPTALAQEYLHTVNADFKTIQERLIYYKGAFTTVSESAQTSRGAFYELTNSIDYFSAVEDTAQDITDIKETLILISSALESKSNLVVPKELEEFDSKLTEYYTKSQAALEQLLEHEEFQMTMLNASGNELNSGLKDFDALINNKVIYSPEEGAQIVYNTASASKESAQRFNQITNVPDFDKKYFAYMNDYHQDLAKTLSEFEELLLAGTENDAVLFAQKLIEFIQRNLEREEQRQANTENMFEESDLRVMFDETAILEQSISNELVALLIKYDVVVSDPSLTPQPAAETDTSDWKIYENEYLNFTFRYPDNWKLETDYYDKNRITLSANDQLNQEKSVVMYIDEEKSGNPEMSLEEYIKKATTQNFSVDPVGDFSKAPKSITKTSTDKIIYYEVIDAFNKSLFFILIPNKPNQFVVFDIQLWPKEETLKEFNQILSTFEFLDEKMSKIECKTNSDCTSLCNLCIEGVCQFSPATCNPPANGSKDSL